MKRRVWLLTLAIFSTACDTCQGGGPQILNLFPDSKPAGDAGAVNDAGPRADAGADAADDQPKVDLDSLKWNPQFEADYNNLVPQPWVNVVTEMQAQTVTVQPDKLVFPLPANADVLQWEEGKVIVSGPSDGPGKNPMGFARRVVSVTQVGNTVEVKTETVALQDIVTGDLQQRLNFDQMKDVDLSKLDLNWAIATLYTDVDVLTAEMPDTMPDNRALPTVDQSGSSMPGSPFFGNIFRAIKSTFETVGRVLGGAAQAVWSAALQIWVYLTPDSFTASASIGGTVEKSYSGDLFNLAYMHSFGEGTRTPIELSLMGHGSIDASVLFKPGAQVGMKIPVPGHDTNFATWLNIDSQFRTAIELTIALDAELASAGGMSGDELEEKLGLDLEFASETLTEAREKFLGDPDMKPAGGLKRTIYMTRPGMQIVFAGPIPVVLTSTFQVDLQCAFVAKASIEAQITYERVTNFRFSARYESHNVTANTPQLDTLTNRSVSVTGGGSLALSCSLIPRVNAFVYDTAGLFAGIRGSLSAEASYESMCAEDPSSNEMVSEVDVSLAGNLGLEVGGRLQAPGSSFAGASGTGAGNDIGPFEVWSRNFPIYERTWELDHGLGFCAADCRDEMVNGDETDMNCGGGCNACDSSSQCEQNTDCARGYCSGGTCSNDPCGDMVLDGDETGIDCGGSCAPCSTGNSCIVGRDCASGFCAHAPRSGSTWGYCVQDHCKDLLVSGDESGIDCGGSSCPKCAVGVYTPVASDCRYGISDNDFCVDSTCRDRKKTSNESDIDCGGGSTCKRCFAGQACTKNTDCASEAPVCDTTAKQCTRTKCMDTAKNLDETDVDCGGSCGGCAVGKACLQTKDCATGLDCDPTSKTCSAASCTDGRKNGAETDVDCGGTCTTKCGVDKACTAASDCAASAPICDPAKHVCATAACPAGQYAVSGTCTNVGPGYYSPAGDSKRYACDNGPTRNGTYTTDNAGSKDCPWQCNQGYVPNVRFGLTNECLVAATTRQLKCDDGEIVVGIHGSEANSLVYNFGLVCAPFNGQQITGPSRSALTIGGTGGNAFEFICPAGQKFVDTDGYVGFEPSPPNYGYCTDHNLGSVFVACDNPDGTPGMIKWVGYQTDTGCYKEKSSWMAHCIGDGYMVGVNYDPATTDNAMGNIFGAICR